MGENTLALVRFEEGSDDGKVGGIGKLELTRLAVLDERVEERRRVFDFHNPGVLPVRVRHAGEENQAAVLGEQDLGLKMARPQEAQNRNKPGAVAQELREQPD